MRFGLAIVMMRSRSAVRILTKNWRWNAESGAASIVEVIDLSGA
jgi:hypothetical protein